MKAIRLFISLILLVIFIGCNTSKNVVPPVVIEDVENTEKTETEVLDGYWPNPIVIIPNYLVFPKEGGEQTVVAEKLQGVCNVYFGDYEGYYIYNRQGNSIGERMAIHQKSFTKQVSWITIVRENENITVIVEPNETGRPRNFGITLGSGDRYDLLYGRQE